MGQTRLSRCQWVKFLKSPRPTHQGQQASYLASSHRRCGRVLWVISRCRSVRSKPLHLPLPAACADGTTASTGGWVGVVSASAAERSSSVRPERLAGLLLLSYLVRVGSVKSSLHHHHAPPAASLLGVTTVIAKKNNNYLCLFSETWLHEHTHTHTCVQVKRKRVSLWLSLGVGFTIDYSVFDAGLLSLWRVYYPRGTPLMMMRGGCLPARFCAAHVVTGGTASYPSASRRPYTTTTTPTPPFGIFWGVKFLDSWCLGDSRKFLESGGETLFTAERFVFSGGQSFYFDDWKI